MPQPFSSPRVVCRHALPRDKADVLEFTKFTWDDGDYIQYVWDDWYADPNGILATAEYGGHCVGIAKVSLSAPGQWWLQGFRVDPKFQDLRIGSHIHDYVDWWWLKNGGGVARLMTSSKRVKVHHLCEKLGYVKALVMKELEAPVLDEACDSFQLVRPGELPDAIQTVLNAPVLISANGLIDLGWDVVLPNEEILLSIQQKSRALWWHDREGLLLTWELGESQSLGISLPACEMESLPALLLDVRRLAALQGYTGIFWIAPLKDKILSAAETAGYVHHREHDNYLYEKHHPLS
ncbi:MAG: GNAT family N-acetyltransferase [Anaerolineales bacterium]|jgi:GNAT superfamily N-acetyltransferase